MATLKISKAELTKIKDRVELWETWMDHPELVNDEDLHDVLEMWRGAHFILRHIGLNLDEA